MDEQYGITDLTHYMNGRPIFTSITQPPSQPHDLHYDMAMLGGGGGLLFRSDSTAGAASTTGGGLEMEIGGGLENEIGGGGGGVGGNCRWPRQETLTLLEVRSSLDSKFKEANHKGPLWDEVSRIMSEEHGYQRSGKKCREKFENLYKYYKKTKEGKAGRQDGKHYRFFRQLEALYGETSTSINPNTTPIPAPFSDPHNLGIETCGFQAHQHSNTNYQELFKPAAPNSRMCDSPTLSNNSSAFDTCSSGYTNPNALIMEKSDGVDTITNTRRLGKRGWKTKIKEFVDAQMRKVMEKQEEWMEKMMRSIEQKEQERVLREEQWRKEENERFEKEHKFWANERAWMESRDAALMEALQRLNGKESCHKSSPEDQNLHDHNNGKIDTTVNVTTWGENELTQLIQLRTSMETRFEHGVGHMEELIWEEIASKMVCMGYNRNGVTCKHKWDSINEFLLKTKKRKESTRSSHSYTHPNNEPIPHVFHHQAGNYRQLADQRLVAPNDESNDGGHRFLVVGQENMWDGYGMKLRMGEDH